MLTSLLAPWLAFAPSVPLPQTQEDPIGRTVAELDSRIWCIRETSDGTLWFGSNGGGVYRLVGERLTQYTPSDGLNGEEVRDLREGADGEMLIATRSGVSKFDGTRFTTLPIVDAPFGSEAWAIEPDDVWMIQDPDQRGPLRYDGETLWHLQLPETSMERSFDARFPSVGYEPSGAYSLYRDRRGHLWFGTAAVGLCRFDGERLDWMYETRLTETPEGGAFGIRSIFEDRDGHFWICNTRQRFELLSGVESRDGDSFLRYTKHAGLPGAEQDSADNFGYAFAITEDEEGALWLACGGAGVWKFDGERVTRYPVEGDVFVISLCRDRSGRLWAGTFGNGVHVFDGTRFVPFSGPRASGAVRER